MVTGWGFLAVDAHLRLPLLLPERVAGRVEADHQAGHIKESDLWIPLATYGTGSRQGILHGANVPSPRDDGRLARQGAQGHQGANLGAELSLGHRLVSKALIGSLPSLLFLADLRGRDL